MHLPQPSLSDPASRRSLMALLGALSVGALAGCAGRNYGPDPTPASPVGSAHVPADGVSLAELGFTNGPVQAWSLPRSSQVSNGVDQLNQITVELTAPDPATIVSYLRRALPPAGFTITNSVVDGARSALIADGYGWRGSVVGADRTLVTLQQRG